IDVASETTCSLSLRENNTSKQAASPELYEKECNGRTVVYWQVKYPYPMYYRDYVYIRERRDLDMDGHMIHVVLAQSTSVPQIPERSDVVRVNQYKQSLAIESDGKKGSRVFMYYFDNPGGLIPSWLINWVAKGSVPVFLKDLANACQNYPRRS
ncbi:phosphatidylcholine transfer protein-like, partial [Ailuropoda melanoleuca]|uniref:phosphatidylcholine transfer protein-like n=1 Tax=Ailuropoda melanoleuca TaxID=9646 RepID=UPI001494BC9F